VFAWDFADIPRRRKGEMSTMGDSMSKVFGVSQFLSEMTRVETALRKDILQRLHKDIGLTDEDVKGGRFFYRGQSNARWGLVPGLFRDRWEQNKRLAYNECLTCVTGRDRNYAEQEWELLAEVERRYPLYFENCRSTLDKLSVLQHYGFPTRLLDVSSNALVALYNAIGVPKREHYPSGECKLSYENDGRVFVFFIPLCELESAYGDQSKNVSYADIHYAYVNRVVNDKAYVTKLKPQFVCPTFLTARQSRQQGCFFLVPSKGKGDVCGRKILAKALAEPAEFEKWKYATIDVPVEAKAEIRKELADHCGITDHILYPETPDGYRQDLLDDLDSRIGNFNI